MHPPTHVPETNAEVIWYTHKSDGDHATVPHGVALCHIPWNTLHPYAVWDLVLREGVWRSVSGTYCEGFSEGREAYAERGGKEAFPSKLYDGRNTWHTEQIPEVDEPILGEGISFDEGSMWSLSGTIIAHGYYNEDDPDGPVYSIMAFMSPTVRAEHRRPEGNGDPRNYAVTFWQNGQAIGLRYFSNIVEAANAYSDEFGMDI